MIMIEHLRMWRYKGNLCTVLNNKVVVNSKIKGGRNFWTFGINVCDHSTGHLFVRFIENLVRMVLLKIFRVSSLTNKVGKSAISI